MRRNWPKLKRATLHAESADREPTSERCRHPRHFYPRAAPAFPQSWGRFLWPLSGYRRGPSTKLAARFKIWIWAPDGRWPQLYALRDCKKAPYCGTEDDRADWSSQGDHNAGEQSRPNC